MITEPMPSMPSDSGATRTGERYRASYFDTFPGVWRHGDWIEITDRGTAIITGRSDATINRGGIRMGTAEIYRAVLALDEVVDALVVDLPREGTQGYMPLFVVLRDGAALDDELVAPDSRPDPRGLLAAARARRGAGGARGAAHALGQGARGAREADPLRRARRRGPEPRLAREPRGATPVRGARGFGRLADDDDLRRRRGSLRPHVVPPLRDEAACSCPRSRSGCGTTSARTGRSRRAARSSDGPSISGSRTSTSRTTTGRRTARRRRRSAGCSRAISRRTATSS